MLPGKTKFSKIDRKAFLKYCGAIAVSLGFGQAYGPKIAKAVETAVQKPPVLWIQAQDCGGCLASAINSSQPSFSELLLEMVSLRYSENLSWSPATALSKKAESVAKEGNHILLVTGAIPMAEDGAYCKVATKDGYIGISEVIKNNAENASAIIACGSCATSGGIINSLGQFRVSPVENLLKNKKVMNIPGCPPHPDWLMAPIVSILLFGEFPKLDNEGKPSETYSKLIHDNCSRRGSFEQGDFASDFLQAQEGKCLYKLGCKGRETSADCPSRKWNQRQNWCIQSNSICIGCASDKFYDQLDPLFSSMPEEDIPAAGNMKARNIGRAIVVGTGVGIAAHEAARRMSAKEAQMEPVDER